MEQEALLKFLCDHLTSTLELEGGFHEGIAPANTCYPYITVQIVDGTDVTTQCGDREFSREIVLLKVWDEGKQRARIGRVYREVDTRIQGVKGVQVEDAEAGLPRSSILGITRLRPYKTKEVHAGKSYHALGGYYLCWVRCETL